MSNFYIMEAMGISEKDKMAISNYFAKKPEVAAVYLYGSQAKGYVRHDSDIDLAILIKNKKSFKGFDIPQTRYTYDLEKMTGRKVEVQDLDAVSIDFAHRVISEGEILLGLDSPKRVEFEERVLRVYFDMKPFFEEYAKNILTIARKGELNVGYI